MSFRLIITVILISFIYPTTVNTAHRPSGKTFGFFITAPPIKPTAAVDEDRPGVPPGWSEVPKVTTPTIIIQSPTTTTTIRPEPTKKQGLDNGALNSTITTTGWPFVLNPNSTTEYKPVENGADRGFVEWLLGLFGLGGGGSEPQKPEELEPPKDCPMCTCGLTYKHNRIVGGVETQVNEYPWMTALTYNNRFYCGASVINNKYLLTAAHCVNGFAKERLSAIFLDHDRSNHFETQTFSRSISKILRHRFYGSGGAYNNDIALLKLDKEIQINGLLKPVCLPTLGKSFTGLKGIATGWGATQVHGQVSNVLREVEVPILSNMDCKKTGYAGKITDNMLCAGYAGGMKDSCQGDSGGPLHIKNDTFHAVVGIVSWGEGCAEPNYPGVYTRVNRYISWIKSNTRDACYCS